MLIAAVALAEGLAEETLPSAAFGDEYASIGYNARPKHNPIAQLSARIDRGEETLAFRPGRLHLEALLEAERRALEEILAETLPAFRNYR